MLKLPIYVFARLGRATISLTSKPSDIDNKNLSICPKKTGVCRTLITYALIHGPYGDFLIIKHIKSDWSNDWFILSIIVNIEILDGSNNFDEPETLACLIFVSFRYAQTLDAVNK